MKIELGCSAKDTITGFSGIVSSITEWLNGCVRVGIQPRELHDGKPIESQTFDIEQLEYVDAGVNLLKRQTGGDRPNPVRHRDPVR